MKKILNKQKIASVLLIVIFFNILFVNITQADSSKVDFERNDKGVVLVNENNTAEKLMKNSEYKNGLVDNIFGVLGNFFLTGFESVNVSGHVYGNVLTKKFNNNVNIGSGFSQEFSYIEENWSGNNLSLTKNNDAILVLGESFNIDYEANMWKINNIKINSPQKNGTDNLWQDNKRKFIDLQKAKEDMIFLSNNLSNMKTSDGFKIVTDQNELNRINMNGVKKAIVIPETNKDSYVYNTTIDDLGKDKIGFTKLIKNNQTIFLNIDTKGKSTIQLPSIVYNYNGQMSTNTERDKPSPGNIIVNVFDSTKADKVFNGKITTGAENNIFLLSPNADVEISQQMNGLVIANTIKNNGTEIHRDRPTTPPITPDPIEYLNISIEKSWKDINGKDINTIIDSNGKEIHEITFLLYNKNTNQSIRQIVLNKNNNWKISLSDLPKFDNLNNEIKYGIKELTNINGFLLNDIKESIQNNIIKFDVINKINIEKIDIPVEKIWRVKDINSIKDKVVEVKLLENGEFKGQTLKLTLDNNWKNSFKNLPTFDSDGNKISYDIEEISIPGFDKGKGGNQENGFTLINAERPIEPPVTPKIDIPVEKVWRVKDINSIKDKVVEVKLLINGEFKGQTLKLTFDKNWKDSFKNLPAVDSNGKKINYDIEEISIPGFDKQISGNQDTGFKVMNTELYKIDIKINKIWKDYDGKTIDGNKIDNSIIVKLFANGKEISKIKIDKDNNWEYIFKNLDEFDSVGNKIVYSIEEEKVLGYETKIVQKDNNFEITNIKKLINPGNPKSKKNPKTYVKGVGSSIVLFSLSISGLYILNKKKK